MEDLLESFCDVCLENSSDAKCENVAVLATRLVKMTLASPHPDTATKFVSVMEKVLDWLMDEIESSDGSEDMLLNVFTDCFRSTRNICCTLPSVQDAFRNSVPPNLPTATTDVPVVCSQDSTAFLQTRVVRFLRLQSKFSSVPSENVDLAFRCLVQSLANMTVNNPQNQSIMLMQPKIQEALVLIFERDDWKCGSYCCMLLSTSFGSEELLTNLIRTETFLMSCIRKMVSVFKQQESEWVVFAVQKLLMQSDFLKTFQGDLSFEERHLVFEILINHLQKFEFEETESNEQLGLKNNLCFMGIEFCQQSSQLFSNNRVSNPSSDFIELLHMLCVATASPSLLPSVQSDSELVMTVTTILIQLTAFSQAQLSFCSTANSPSECDHFRRDVIRLLGNLCWKHKRNQDIVRDLNGIPAVLNSFNVDGKSPFIRQWAVFALRNLCEDNLCNQELVAGLQMQGAEDRGGVLEELGLEVEIEGGKPRLKRKIQ